MLVALLLGGALGQLLGIDIGTEYWKAGLISPGRSFAAVQNSKSDRKTVNSLAIKDGDRFFEDQSLRIGGRNLEQGYFSLKKYFKALGDKAKVEALQRQFGQANQYTLENGSLLFGYKDEKGEQGKFSLQQLQAMIFRNIRINAKKMVGAEPRDTVLVVPANWDFNARTSFLNSAQIAGLNVLGLVTQNTAAAVHYALSRNDSTPVLVLFANLGYFDFHLTLIEFSGVEDKATAGKFHETVRVILDQTVQGVGSMKFNDIVLGHIQTVLKQKKKVSLYDQPRALRKAMATSEKVKETLSASKQVPIYIQGLLSGYDFSSTITKAYFNEKASPLLRRIQQAIKEFIAKANVQNSEIKAVELIGGGVRVPAVVTAINQTVTGSDVGTHINGDQAMALGAVFMAANMSSSYRVKKVFLQDGFPITFDVYIKSGESKLHTGRLFDPRQAFGSERTFTYQPTKINHQIQVLLYKDGDLIKSYTFPGLLNATKDPKFENATDKFTFNVTLRLDSVQVIKVDAHLYNRINKTVVTSEVKYEFVQEKIKRNKTQNETVQAQGQTATQTQDKEQQGETDKGKLESKGEEQADKSEKIEEDRLEKEKQEQEQNKKEQEQDKKEQDKEQEQDKKQEQEQQEQKQAEQQTEQQEEGQAKIEGAQNQIKPEGNETASNETAKNQTKKKEKVKRLKPVRKVINTTRYEIQEIKMGIDAVLSSQTFTRLFEKEQVQALTASLVRLEQVEEQKHKKAELKNTLESTVYQFKDYMQNAELMKFLTQDERKNMSQATTAAGSWLQQNGFTAPVDQLQKQYNVLLDSVQPLRNRTEQRRTVETTYNKTASSLKYLYGRYLQLQKANPFLSEMVDQQIKAIMDGLTAIVGRINATFEQPLHLNPQIYNWQIVNFANQAREKYITLSSLSKFKIPKTKAQTEAQEEQARAQGQGQDQGKGQDQGQEANQQGSKEQAKGGQSQEQKGERVDENQL